MKNRFWILDFELDPNIWI